MCHTSVLEFFIENVSIKEFEGRRVLEIGSKFVNGSVRPFIEMYLKPKEWVGVDIETGRFVDLVLPAEDIVKHFGEESFDVVVTPELLEHVLDWRLVINNIKKVVRKGGIVYITTRSKGFPYHSYPYDFWRYEIEDIYRIFADFDIVSIFPDCEAPGLFLKARKREDSLMDLDNIGLYSMVLGERTDSIPKMENMPCTRKTMSRIIDSRLGFYLPSNLRYRLKRRYQE